MGIAVPQPWQMCGFLVFTLLLSSKVANIIPPISLDVGQNKNCIFEIESVFL